MTHSKTHELIIVVLVFLIVALGTLNRVFYKILMGPITDTKTGVSFNVLIAATGVVQATAHALILMFRLAFGISSWSSLRQMYVFSGIKRHDDLAITGLPPMLRFAITGFMDSLGVILGLVAAPYVSGQTIGIMGQAIVIFSMVTSYILVRARYSVWQVLSGLVVLLGSVLSLMPALLQKRSPHDSSGSQYHVSSPMYIFYASLVGLSSLPGAISFTIKESFFMQYKKLDVFIVTSHGSVLQSFLLTPLIIPLQVYFVNTGHRSVGQYIYDGAQCILMGINPIADPSESFSCQNMTKPLWPSLPFTYPLVCYITLNLLFNISIIYLLKFASSLMSFLAINAILPVSLFAFTITWPLLPGSPIDVWMGIGLAVIVIGLAGFRYFTKDRERVKEQDNEDVAVCLPISPLYHEGKSPDTEDVASPDAVKLSCTTMLLNTQNADA